MKWSELRERYPEQWLLVEAVEAHSDADRRVLDELAVVRSYPDSVAAMHEYREFHRRDPGREFYVLHTRRETLDIEERRWLGVRAHP